MSNELPISADPVTVLVITLSVSIVQKKNAGKTIMTQLKTTEEYQSIARQLTLPSKAVIDGEIRSALSGATFSTVNPANGEHLADVAACSSADVDVAVSAARAAFNDGRWSKLHRSEEHTSELQSLMRISYAVF